MNYHLLPIPLLCLYPSLCTQLYAQQINDNIALQQTTTLNTIVTTASRSAQSIADIAGTVYRIPHEEIAKQINAGKSTADILAILVPSLTASSGTRSNYGMTMRGRIVQYMIDGVPQTGSRDSSRQLNSIQPLMIERIEVISGASSIYGSGATGGIINIITKKDIQAPLSFATTVGISSQNKIKNDALAYEISQSMSFKQHDLSASLSVGLVQRGEIQDSQGQRIAPEIAQTDYQDTKTWEFNGRLNWQINSAQNLTIGAQYFKDTQKSEYGADYGTYGSYRLASLLLAQSPSLKVVPGLSLKQQPETERWQFNSQYQHEHIWGDQYLNIEAYYRKEKGRWFPTVSPLGHQILNTILAQRYPNYKNPFHADFLKAIAQNYAVVQSENEVDVWGIRLALQKELMFADRKLTLTYGTDYGVEKDQAAVTRFNFADFYSSNGLNYQPIKHYPFGPDVHVNTWAMYLQGQYQLHPQLYLQLGIRHERIDSQVASSIPYRESIPADILQNLAVDYLAKQLQGGQIKHHATLYNLGLVYDLNDQQQIFANFSQGFSIADVQRMLRDVPAYFIVTSNNIDPIKVNNYELGWRIQGNQDLNIAMTAFYNDSDKVIKFHGAPAYNLEIMDSDERIYGLETSLGYPLSINWHVGGTLAYTRGQFKNHQKDWQELDATRIAPLKATLFSEWQWKNMGLRLQALAIASSHKAQQDQLTLAAVAQKVPAEIHGFTTMDIISNFKVGPGTLRFGIYNVWNRNYKTVFSQVAATTYGQMSSLAAEGRSFALSYHLQY